jgi:hypothetical protein
MAFRGSGVYRAELRGGYIVGQIGGEILPVHGYHDGRGDRYRSFRDLVLFRLVAHPLQLGVVGPYLV